MKKAKATIKKPSAAIDSTDLRRWCIENAIRWPVEGQYNNAGVYGGGHRVEADVIGRAQKLFNWVTTPNG